MGKIRDSVPKGRRTVGKIRDSVPKGSRYSLDVISLLLTSSCMKLDFVDDLSRFSKDLFSIFS